MLGKKSLAIALMGLGLAGSCFAASNSVTVNFSAAVNAATCKFAVLGGATGASSGAAAQDLAEGTASFAFTSVTLNNNPQPQKMTFQLDCSNGNPGYVPFTSVTIQADKSGALTVNGTNGGTAKFVFYDDEDGVAGDAWSSGTINFTAGTANTYTEDKWVGFEMDANSKAGNYTENVKYTATYK